MKEHSLACAVMAIFFSMHSSAQARTWDKLIMALESADRQQQLCARDPDRNDCEAPTVSEMVSICEGNSAVESGQCAGFLLGAAERLKENRREWACAPDDLSINYLRASFLHLAYIAPEAAKYPADLVLGYAVATDYPCIDIPKGK